MNTVEACEYLRYTGKHRLRSLYRFIQQQGIRTARRGRRVLLASLERPQLEAIFAVDAFRRPLVLGLAEQVGELDIHTQIVIRRSA